MKRIAWALLLAACGGTPPSTPAAPGTSPPAARASEVLAGHYAALFESGRHWRYQATMTHAAYSPSNPKADKDGWSNEASTATAKCEVVEVRAWKQGVMSRITCVEPLTPCLAPAGAWIADARGLWRIDDPLQAGAEPDLTKGYLVIAAAPKPGAQAERGAGVEEGFVSTELVQQEAGAWCVTSTSSGGDASLRRLCFAPAGPVSGRCEEAGGSYRRSVAFELAK